MAFGFAYRWLDQNVISYILNFVRGFEHALVMLTVIAFLLIMVYMMIKHVKRLPKYYGIEIVDIWQKDCPDRDRLEEFYNKNGRHLYSNFRTEWSSFRSSSHIYKS